MLLFIILFFLLLIPGIKFSLKVDYYSIEWIFFSFIMSAMISVVIVTTFSFIAEKNFEYELVETESIDIVALSNDSKVEGSFFLVSGTVDEHSVYYYMEDTDKGTKMDYVKTENTFINETSDEDPTIKKFSYRFTNNILDNLLRHKYTNKTEVIINVPARTIDKEFNINLDKN